MNEATGSKEYTEFVENEYVVNTSGQRGSMALWFLPSPRQGRPGGMRREFWPFLIGFGYVAFVAFMGGLRGDHVFIGSLCLLDAYNLKSRAFLRLFFPFILTGVLYDLTRYFYWNAVDGRVHVAEPYFRDLRWFGIPFEGEGSKSTVTPNEYFARRPSVWLDLLCGFAYLVFVAEYLAMAFFLFFREKLRRLWMFGWCFLAVNVMGYLTYFVYPAAPPWYVSKFGLGPAKMNISADAAAAARFDEILGTHFFDQIYGRGIAVYGAYPSLHVAYPLMVAWVCFAEPGLRKLAPLAVAFYALMCFSAIYLQHHYVVDVLLGSVYALIVIFVMSRFFEANSTEPAPAR